MDDDKACCSIQELSNKKKHLDIRNPFGHPTTKIILQAHCLILYISWFCCLIFQKISHLQLQLCTLHLTLARFNCVETSRLQLPCDDIQAEFLFPQPVFPNFVLLLPHEPDEHGYLLHVASALLAPEDKPKLDWF